MEAGATFYIIIHFYLYRGDIYLIIYLFIFYFFIYKLYRKR